MPTRKSGVENPQPPQAYLSFRGEGDRIVTGLGLFSKGIPPEPVSDSIARQFESEEMKNLGWVVEWRDPSRSTTTNTIKE